MKRMVFKLGEQYLESNYASDEAGDNHELHSRLRDIFGGKTDDPQKFEEALFQIKYRMSLMPTVDRYLDFMEVPYPNGQQCYEYNEADSWNWTSPDDHQISEMLRERASVLFPHPAHNQGRWFSKGVSYIGTALTLSSLSVAVIRQKLDVLVVIIEGELKQQAQLVKEVPEVKSKRQKLWEVLRRVGNMSPVESRFRSTSPKKCRSRGRSLGQKRERGF